MDFAHFDLPRYLSHLPLFHGMGEAALERVAARAQLRRLARGDAVYGAEDCCAHYLVIVVGQVKLVALSAAGQEKVIELAGPGIALGEAQLMTGGAYGFSAQAIADTLLLRLDRQALLDELAQDPRLAMRLLHGLSSRLQGLMHDVQAYTLHSGLQRVVDYLLGDAPGHARADTFTVSLPASKATIASRLSITPEYFSRVLGELEAAGLIAIERRTIRVRDPARLAGQAGNARGAAAARAGTALAMAAG